MKPNNYINITKRVSTWHEEDEEVTASGHTKEKPTIIPWPSVANKTAHAMPDNS